MTDYYKGCRVCGKDMDPADYWELTGNLINHRRDTVSNVYPFALAEPRAAMLPTYLCKECIPARLNDVAESFVKEQEIPEADSEETGTTRESSA